MTDQDTLSPLEASKIANNAYFSLKAWIFGLPQAATENFSNVHNRVLGAGNAGNSRCVLKKPHLNSSLKGTDLADSRLVGLHSAQTGFGTTSGFGYTLQFERTGKRHVVIAVRGTRPEMAGMPDLITDLRGSMTSFGSFGPVHKGFKRVYDSMQPSLLRSASIIEAADVVHFVGHSLGGAVATLLAADFAARGKQSKLYTYGSPRPGAFGTYRAFEQKIGKDNIYRVAFDLDPISLIGPFPYIHTNPKPYERNNMTLQSPQPILLGTANHDMGQYMELMEENTWDGIRAQAKLVDHENALICRWLLHESRDAGWVQYASAKTLALLFKLFNHVLKGLSTSVIIGLTGIDLLAELLYKGLHHIEHLGAQVKTLLQHAARWAGIQIKSAADFTHSIIKNLLDRMLNSVRNTAMQCLLASSNHLVPGNIPTLGVVVLKHLGVL